MAAGGDDRHLGGLGETPDRRVGRALHGDRPDLGGTGGAALVRGRTRLPSRRRLRDGAIIGPARLYRLYGLGYRLGARRTIREPRPDYRFMRAPRARTIAG